MPLGAALIQLDERLSEALHRGIARLESAADILRRRARNLSQLLRKCGDALGAHADVMVGDELQVV